MTVRTPTPGGTIRAAVLHGPGDLRIETLPRPTPAKGEIAVRTLAATTCGTDRKVVRRGYHSRILRPPARIGHELVGEVVEAGADVGNVAVGDRLVIANSAPCGRCNRCASGRESLCEDLLFWNGAFGDVCVVPSRVVEKNVVPLGGAQPELAAMTEPLACCVKGVEEASVKVGQRVLIVGLGSIGLMLTALASRNGARVTACARREDALQRSLRMGAHEALPFSQISERRKSFDVVFDAGGSEATAAAALACVAAGGVLSLFAGPPAATEIRLDVARSHYDEIRILGSFHHTPRHFREAFRLIAAGAVDLSPLLSERIRLEDLPSRLLDPPRDVLKSVVVF